MNITEQVESIKYRFGTKKIFDKTSRVSLTDNEIEAIIQVIKHERTDGEYEINDEILVVLEKGACHIHDNNNENE